MTKPKLVIAVPTLRPLKNGAFPKSVLRFAQEFAAIADNLEVVMIHTPEPREAHAVNLLIDQFLSMPEAVLFVWWDLTVQMAPGDLVKLVEAQVPVIGALFTDCGKRPQWQASFYPDVMPGAPGGVFPVAELGAGVKVYRRAVLEKISLERDDLPYIYDNSGKALTAFCTDQLASFGEYNRLLSPAYSLDLKCREAGIQVFAHAGVVLKRRGPDSQLHPTKEISRPWTFRREPPPVDAATLPDTVGSGFPMLICLQYCDKDREQAMRLNDWITEVCGLPVEMCYSRGDQYPRGPNEKALELMRRGMPINYSGVILLEPDCIPVNANWFGALARDWMRARAAGKLIMGSWHPVNTTHPKLGHLNGNLVFDPRIASLLEGVRVPDDEPWDTWLADVFAPVWCRTGLIKNLNRHRTATLEQITKPECGTVAPVLIHGVRDESVWNYAKENCT